jgi:hypothetical protein
MKIRTVIVAVITAGMIASFCLGQDTQEQSSRYPQLLGHLRSAEIATRRKAFQEVHSNPSMLKDPDVRSALLDLLDRENRHFDTELKKGERERAEHENGNSEYSESAMYMDDLVRAIESFVNWHDPRQVCLLVKAGAMLESSDSHESATRAQVAMPCLQQLMQSDLFMDRLNAVRISLGMLASGKGSLDPDTTEAMKQAVILALHDKRTEVQWEAVDGLERYGTPDMIPALKELASSVPGPSATKDEIEVRKNATRAIGAIEHREDKQ